MGYTQRVEEIFGLRSDAVSVAGNRQDLNNKLGLTLPDAALGALFGGIRGSHLEIAQGGKNVDIWTSHDWFETPLYFSIERDAVGVILTINDFFLKETAPKTLGTRIVAGMIFQAVKIPSMISIQTSATRFYAPRDEGMIRELQGYYFFPRLGFNADPKDADDYIEIPPDLKGKKLLYIMRDPDLRQWWKENGQTIDVNFKLRGKKNLRALLAYLFEKGIEIPDPTENAYLPANHPDE